MVSRDARVELGVGLAGEDLDLVAEGDQLPAEVPDVDALAAAVGLAAVGQQCDAQRRDLSLGHPDIGRMPRRGRHAGPDEVERVPIMPHALLA